MAVVVLICFFNMVMESIVYHSLVLLNNILDALNKAVMLFLTTRKLS